MGPKKDLKRDAATDVIEPGSADLPLEEIVERAVKRAMEKVVESVNETLRKEIQELRQSIQSTVESVVANFKQALDDRVSPIEAKVRELEEIATVMSDQVSQNIDSITSLSL